MYQLTFFLYLIVDSFQIHFKSDKSGGVTSFNAQVVDQKKALL